MEDVGLSRDEMKAAVGDITILRDMHAGNAVFLHVATMGQRFTLDGGKKGKKEKEGDQVSLLTLVLLTLYLHKTSPFYTRYANVARLLSNSARTFGCKRRKLQRTSFSSFFPLWAERAPLSLSFP